jgi:hypothetical protein
MFKNPQKGRLTLGWPVCSVRLKNHWLQLLMVPEAREVKNATDTSIWRNSMFPGIYFIILASDSQPLDIELRNLFKDQEKITCRLKMLETASFEKIIYLPSLCGWSWIWRWVGDLERHMTRIFRGVMWRPCRCIFLLAAYTWRTSSWQRSVLVTCALRH